MVKRAVVALALCSLAIAPYEIASGASIAATENSDIVACPTQLPNSKSETRETKKLNALLDSASSALSTAQSHLAESRQSLGAIKIFLADWFSSSPEHNVYEAIEARIEKGKTFQNECPDDENKDILSENIPWKDYCEVRRGDVLLSRDSYESWRRTFANYVEPRRFADVYPFCASIENLNPEHADEPGEANMVYKNRYLHSPAAECGFTLNRYAKTYDEYVAAKADEKRLRMRVQALLKTLRQCYGSH